MQRSHRILTALLLTACLPAASHGGDLLDLLNGFGRWQGIGYSEGYHACRPDQQAIQPVWNQHLGAQRSRITNCPAHLPQAHNLDAPRPMDQLSSAPAGYPHEAWSAPQPPVEPAPAPPPPAPTAVKTELPEAWKALSLRI